MSIKIDYKKCKDKKCTEQPCVEICPANALIHGKQIQYDSLRCVDCELCMTECEHGAISEK